LFTNVNYPAINIIKTSTLLKMAKYHNKRQYAVLTNSNLGGQLWKRLAHRCFLTEQAGKKF